MYFLCLHLVSLLQGTRNLMIMNDYDHGNSSFLILYDSELMVQILTPGASLLGGVGVSHQRGVAN